MDVKISKRRKVLLDRLKILCNRFDDVDLPASIKNLVGFGSFFRQKENPKDVDLILVIQRTEEQVRQFKEFLSLLWNSYKEFWEQVETLKQGLQKFFEKYPHPKAKKYLKWAEVCTCITKVNVWELCIKLLVKDLPNIKIMEVLTDLEHISLATNVKYIIWSDDMPKVDLNIQHIWENNSENIKKEYINLYKQNYIVKKCLDVYLQACKTGIENQGKNVPKIPNWVYEFDTWGYQAAKNIRIPKNPIPNDINEEIESLRKILKQHWIEFSFWKSVYYEIDEIDDIYMENLQSNYNSCVAYRVLANRSKKIEDDKVRKMLAKIGVDSSGVTCKFLGNYYTIRRRYYELNGRHI